MKKIIVILMVVLFISCTSLRYGDNLTEPYTQEEMDMGGTAAIGFAIAGVFLGQYIYEEVK